MNTNKRERENLDALMDVPDEKIVQLFADMGIAIDLNGKKPFKGERDNLYPK